MSLKNIRKKAEVWDMPKRRLNIATKTIVYFLLIMLVIISLNSCGGTDKVDPTAKKATITIDCHTATEKKHNGELDKGVASVVSDDGFILPKTEVVLQKDDTVLSVLLRVTKENKIHTSYQGQTSYGTAYVEAIGNLFEKDCGKKSGWMYFVNGKYPNYGCSNYDLEGNEDIVWIYTCKNGKDINAKLEE